MRVLSTDSSVDGIVRAVCGGLATSTKDSSKQYMTARLGTARTPKGFLKHWAALWASYGGQSTTPWCTDSVLSSSPRIGQMRPLCHGEVGP